ncbi:MAG: hypothetical protein LBH18_03935, partial [Spirochaetaceae bacterium]|nr:hypothetical protein [Spirochaetaceae bacterium]
AFETAVAEALVRYPYSAVFPRLLFRHAAKKTIPTERERALVEDALKRLPSLLKADGELIRFAAPFIGNIEESRRLLSIWRSGELGRLSEESASGVPSAKRWTALLESLPVSLEIGLIDEETAINELFHQDSAAAESPELEREILFSVWDLLRTDEARAAMRNELSSFSGTITGDENGDGIIDSITLYDEGIVVSYSQDADQDRVNELVVAFDAGWPVNTEFTYANGTGYGGEDKILLVWDVYPALREAVWGETRYVFRPMEFNCPVTGFETLGGPGGILLPDGAADGGFSKQTFLSYAYLIERPGRDFPGGIERFECDNGVVLSSKEYLDGVLRAETAYENGQPVLQRIDLDADGRLETIRRFKRTADTILSSEIEVIESDWDGDGFAEYREAQ